MLDKETLTSGILTNFCLSVADLSDSGDLVGGLSDLLGLLDKLLGLGSDLLLFVLNHLLEVLDLLLQGSSSLDSLFLGSLLDFLRDFGSSLRGEGGFKGLGFLLNSLSLLFDSIDIFSKLKDLLGDHSLIIFRLLLLNVFTLDGRFFGSDGTFKIDDSVLDLLSLNLSLDDHFLISEDLDLILTFSNDLVGGLDSLVGLDLGYSMSSLLSLELSGLTLNSLLSLGGSVSVLNSILFNLDDSVLVRMSVVSSSDSIDRRSLNLLGNLLGIGCLSFHLDVIGVVVVPGCRDCLNRCFDRSDLGLVYLDRLFVSGDLSFDGRDLSLNSLLLFFLSFLNFFLEDIKSRVQLFQFSGSSNL